MRKKEATILTPILILSANPLIGLSGNMSILQEINRRIEKNKKFAFMYVDNSKTNKIGVKSSFAMDQRKGKVI